MGIQFPKCGSEHVQSIKAVLQSRTVYNTGSINGIGLGTSGAGVFAGNSISTSQTMLPARFAPPKKPSKIEIIAGGVLALAASPWLFSKSPLMFISLGLLAWWAWEACSFTKKNKQYQKDYPVWKAFYNNAYLCHHCGNYFFLGNSIFHQKQITFGCFLLIT